MTEENKRYNIALELAEAEDRLANADVVLERGSCKTASTLAYYAAFHHARALLLMEGLESRTHSEVIHLVNLHFVRTDRLSPQLGKILGDLQRDRERADDAAAVVTADMAAEAVGHAHTFAAAVRELLQNARYL